MVNKFIDTSIPKKIVPNKNGYIGMAYEQSLHYCLKAGHILYCLAIRPVKSHSLRVRLTHFDVISLIKFGKKCIASMESHS